uniref:NAD-dependent epimerase/dehydratase domain-containing protein n=1 Tax=Graphocephala atropunctata TaxID=36148 RepID=A0A1B6M4V8_9HEMI
MAENVVKPRVIIFGGCGFVGRNLVEYMITNELVSGLRVVDKVPPQIAWLNKQLQDIFDDPLVEFKSVNLIIQGAAELAFENGDFEYAINCAGETKLGQTEQVYEEGVYKVSVNCASAAAKHGVKRFLEVSSGQVDSNEKVEHKESDPVKPWTKVAKYKLQVESYLKTIPGLKYTIIRPAIVYGTGDRSGLTPRLVLGCIYQHLGESMKLLWSRDLVMNTVHVRDVCRALWFLSQRDDTVGQVYNVVDDSHTTQGSVTEIISDIYNINYDYYGNILSTICKGDLSVVVEEANDKHMGPWAEVCRVAKVENTPLSPYIHQELLDKKHLHLSNEKLKATGFTLTQPVLTKQLLLQIIDDFAEMKLFPRMITT